MFTNKSAIQVVRALSRIRLYGKWVRILPALDRLMSTTSIRRQLNHGNEQNARIRSLEQIVVERQAYIEPSKKAC